MPVERVSNCVLSTSTNFYDAEVMQLAEMGLVVLLLFHPWPDLLVMKTRLFTPVRGEFPTFWVCWASVTCLLRKKSCCLILVHFMDSPVICI